MKDDDILDYFGEDEDEHWEILAIYHNPTEAGYVAGYLREEGVPARLSANNMEGMPSNWLAEYPIYVQEARLEEAEVLLERLAAAVENAPPDKENINRKKAAGWGCLTLWLILAGIRLLALLGG